MPVETLATPEPSRLIATSMSVSLVLRLRLAVRMKWASGPWLVARSVSENAASPPSRREAGFFRIMLSKTRPFNRRPPPSLLRYGLLRTELPLIVTGMAAKPADCNPAPQPLNQRTRGNLMQASQNEPPVWHGTTILTVRKGGRVVIGGDGQVSIGQTVIKSNAKKVRKLGKGDVIGGFAGATADAFTLFERLESKLEQYPGQLTRAAVELAKDWRTDRYLRRLEAMMIVTDKDAETIVRRALDIAADICVYTNRNVTIETLQGS